MRTCPLISSLLSLILSGTSTRALVLAGGGQGNTNAPTDDPGWANVGHELATNTSAVSTVVYLGNGWFITADHVWNLDNPTGVLVDASTYTVDSSSWVQLTNSLSPYAGTNADLAMFRVTTTVTGLPILSLRSTSLRDNSPVTMIGYGYGGQTNMTYWDSSWNVTTSASGVYSGFYWGASAGIEQWGTNLAAPSSWVDDGYGISRTFDTTFNANGGANAAQAAEYDSGGAVFYKNGSTWQLTGIMIDINGYSDQPGNAAVFGDQTYSVDLSSYNSEIVSLMAIPEPASVFVVGAGVLLAVRMVRRWRT